MQGLIGTNGEAVPLPPTVWLLPAAWAWPTAVMLIVLPDDTVARMADWYDVIPLGAEPAGPVQVTYAKPLELDESPTWLASLASWASSLVVPTWRWTTANADSSDRKPTAMMAMVTSSSIRVRPRSPPRRAPGLRARHLNPPASE